MAQISRDAAARWDRFDDSVRALQGSYFRSSGPTTTTRAPGRLDVMGGIADYSGATVLEMPLSCAAHCALQPWEGNSAEVRTYDSSNRLLQVEMSFAELNQRRASVFADPKSRWAAYVLGAIPVLLDEGLFPAGHSGGFRFYLESDVPIGAGVSSSAALEVSAMMALSSMIARDGGTNLADDGMRLARLCQRVENEIAGAPCGIMDQVTSALGVENKLLALDCRPHTLLGNVEIPQGWRFVGLDSGVKHSVGGSHYTRARVSAFMGLRILEVETGRHMNGYLCNLTAGEWERLRDSVPREMSGREYLENYGALPDSVTTVVPEELYFPRSASEHPILENERVKRFSSLLGGAGDDTNAIREAGQLMLESHRSYSDRVHLGSPETDRLVEMLLERGPECGIYGAKITGGGSGGTVAVLCTGPDAHSALEDVRTQYRERTGILPQLFEGSSPGALACGVRTLDSTA